MKNHCARGHMNGSGPFLTSVALNSNCYINIWQFDEIDSFVQVKVIPKLLFQFQFNILNIFSKRDYIVTSNRNHQIILLFNIIKIF